MLMDLMDLMDVCFRMDDCGRQRLRDGVSKCEFSCLTSRRQLKQPDHPCCLAASWLLPGCCLAAS